MIDLLIKKKFVQKEKKQNVKNKNKIAGCFKLLKVMLSLLWI